MSGVKIEAMIDDVVEDFAIPNSDIQIQEYHDPNRGADVAKVFFRTNNLREKFGFEISVSNNMPGIVRRELRDHLSELERSFIESKDNIVNYGGRLFSWETTIYVREGGHPEQDRHLEFECLSCGHTSKSKRVSPETLSDNQPLIMAWLLEQTRRDCDCCS